MRSANDRQSRGPSAVPRRAAQRCARAVALPAIKDADAIAGFYGRDGEIAEFHVIGSKDGWFLVEGATYQEPSRPKLYAGRGWVDGKLITTHLFRDTLKKAPSTTAADVVYLSGTDPQGFSYSPYSIEPGRILGCSGAWFEVELWLPAGRTVFGAAVPGDGTLRGWTDRSCTQQQNRPCTSASSTISAVALARRHERMQFPGAERRS